MLRLKGLIRDFFCLIKCGQPKVVWEVLRRHIYSNNIYIGLRRDLQQPLELPRARIPISIRNIKPRENPELLDCYREGLTSDQISELIYQKKILESGLKECYLAVNEQNKPTYMQWMIPSSENAKVQELFGKDFFPRLNEDEVLLEAAFTYFDFRSKGIMPRAMAEIANAGSEFGARYAITFCHEWNTPSIKGCKKAGFQPYLQRDIKYRFFRRSFCYKELSPAQEDSPV